MSDMPARTAQHDALEAFLGKWTAHGTSYGGTDQSGDNPKANGEIWVTTHEAAWHTGGFFLVHDERADIAGSRFDNLSVMGVAEDGTYFSRGFENHGFHRHHKVTRDAETCASRGRRNERASCSKTKADDRSGLGNGSQRTHGSPFAIVPRNASIDHGDVNGQLSGQ